MNTVASEQNGAGNGASADSNGSSLFMGSSQQSNRAFKLHPGHAAFLLGVLVVGIGILTIALSDEIDRQILNHVEFLSRVLVLLLPAIVVIFSFAVEGPLPRRIMAVLFCVLATHVPIILMSAILPLRVTPQLIFMGAFLSLAFGITIALLRVVYRKRIVSVIATDLGPEALKQIDQDIRLIDDPKADPCGLDLLVVPRSVLSTSIWADFVARAAVAGCEIQSVTNYVKRHAGRIHLDGDEPLALACLNRPAYRLVKRAMDIAIVLLMAPLVLAILAVASMAILIDMGRPILFVQDRVGQAGRVFRMYKLRTMHNDPATKRQNATAKNDGRITRLGRLLRRYHIDELPQLWNVLIGEMTLIGPRPEQPALVAAYAEHLPGYDLRHLVRPGITGWSQVRFGYAETLEETREKIEFDLFYLERFGPALDAEIALRTIIAIFDPNRVR
ncbi:sugar transferase [Microvirga vignae]|uniref:sugar transferase n=1 Tax=Microvirga vignae TaxID=1225564 RepID=UPI0012372295|nr:sugar transferase [Microvirga vignae]